MRDINRLLWVFLALGHVARVLGRKRIYLDGLPPFTKPANELASAGLDVPRKLACRGCTYIILQHCTVSQRSFLADVQHRRTSPESPYLQAYTYRKVVKVEWAICLCIPAPRMTEAIFTPCGQVSARDRDVTATKSDGVLL
ncbi:hypothetical protein F4806DRAFT_498200 [Annulohypoxylon nitens]|nr:hypothetical protein F4806DRAFT_498200 [Annulohypoxylon nitens]